MRRRPVVALPTGLDQQLSEFLSQALGFLHPLLIVPVVLNESGLATTPATLGTALLSSQQVIEWPDTGCDEWRIVGYGEDADSIDAAVAYWVNGVELARASVPQGAPGVMTGPWTRLPPRTLSELAGDQVGQVIGYGDGASVVTWYSLAIQARTVSRMW